MKRFPETARFVHSCLPPGPLGVAGSNAACLYPRLRAAAPHALILAISYISYLAQKLWLINLNPWCTLVVRATVSSLVEDDTMV
jgi:hypothetical protein